MITLKQIEANLWQHAVNDRRKPTRYAVLRDGVKVAEVASRSRESWDSDGRIRTRFRGYSRWWVVEDLTGRVLSISSTSRKDVLQRWEDGRA